MLAGRVMAVVMCRETLICAYDKRHLVSKLQIVKPCILLPMQEHVTAESVGFRHIDFLSNSFDPG